MRIIPDDVKPSIDLDGNEVFFMDKHKSIEITDDEWNKIWNSFFKFCTDTTKPYDPKREFVPFSQYLRELIELKER